MGFSSLSLDKSITMNFMKNMANSAAEGMAKAADAVQTAAGEKELQAKIWNDDRKITSLKGEWGVAAYDAFMAKSDTLNAITENFTAQINELREKISANTQKLQDEYGHAPAPDPDAQAAPVPCNTTLDQ